MKPNPSGRDLWSRQQLKVRTSSSGEVRECFCVGAVNKILIQLSCNRIVSLTIHIVLLSWFIILPIYDVFNWTNISFEVLSLCWYTVEDLSGREESSVAFVFTFLIHGWKIWRHVSGKHQNSYYTNLGEHQSESSRVCWLISIANTKLTHSFSSLCSWLF